MFFSDGWLNDNGISIPSSASAARQQSRTFGNMGDMVSPRTWQQISASSDVAATWHCPFWSSGPAIFNATIRWHHDEVVDWENGASSASKIECEMEDIEDSAAMFLGDPFQGNGVWHAMDH